MVVDDELGAARDARLADLARDDRGVAGGAATRRQDALGHGHAVEVVGRGLDPDEDDLLAAMDPVDRGVGAEHGPPDGRARGGVEALRDAGRLLERDGIELVAQQLVDVGGLDPADRLFLGDRALVDHVGGDLDGRGGGPFGRARLEHVQPPALDRELEVLDVAVVRLELLADALELGVHLGHVGRHLGDLRGRPDAGHDVLALGVGQVLAVEDLLAGVRVACERHAGAGVVAHVAEDHRDDVDGRAQVVGDVLVLPIVRRALTEPRGEDRLDREVQLLVRVLGEVAPGVRLDDALELPDEVAQGGRIEVRVLLRAVLGLGGVQRVVEALAADFHHDPAEHLDEAAVGVPAEALVAGELDEPLDGLLVEAQVEHRVHHPGHGELGAGADAHEERVGGIAEALAGAGLDVLHGREDVIPQAVGQPLPVVEVVVAGLGRDRETGWRRQAGARHLGQARALAAQEVTHPGVALRPAVAPGVDVALGGLVRAVGRRGGRGHGRNLRAGWRTGHRGRHAVRVVVDRISG